MAAEMASRTAEERSLGQLVSDASRDISELVRFEIALAKAELADDVRRGAAAGGLLGGAGYVVMLATVTLVLTFAFGLVALGLSPWLAFLAVSVVLLLLAGALVLVAVSQLKRIKPPERAIRSTRETIAVVRGERPQSGAATTPAPGRAAQ